jgi:hypothetical protein
LLFYELYFEDNSIDVYRRILLDKDDMIQMKYDSKIIPSGFQHIPFEKNELNKKIKN